MATDFRDISVIFCRKNKDWCDYLLNYHLCKNELNLRVETVDVEELTYENPPEIEVAVRESHVVFLLTTLGLLEYMESKAEWMSGMLKKRNPDFTSIVAASVGLSTDEIIGIRNLNYDVDDWAVLDVDVTGATIKDTIAQILDLVESNTLKYKASRKKPSSRLPPSQSSGSLGTSPRNSQGSSTPRSSNYYSPSPPSSQRNSFGDSVEIIPETVRGPGEKVALIFYAEINGHVDVLLGGHKEKCQVTVVNPYCVTFITPESISEGKTFIQVNVNGVRKYRLNLLVKSQMQSIVLLQQSLGVSSLEELDIELRNRFNTSLCSSGPARQIFQDLLSSSEENFPVNASTRYPTLIHWAADNGLKELCSAMLEAPGSMLACQINNADGLDPTDLARDSGHADLAQYIYEYQETAQLCDIYVQVCDTTSQKEPEGNLYEEMSMSPQSPSPKHDRDPPPPILPPRKHSVSQSPIDRNIQQVPPPEPSDDLYVLPEEPKQLINARLQTLLSGGAIGCRSQLELINIQQGVKKGDYSIPQAEAFFRSWSQRYGQNNSMSFRQRQQSIQTIRDENSVAMNQIQKMGMDKKTKKMRKKSEKEEEKLHEISEPFVIRDNSGSCRKPNVGRGSNTSVDSGRDSAVSQSSTISTEIEPDRTNMRRKSETSFARPEGAGDRQSRKDLYLTLVAYPEEPPPPVPPRPSIKIASLPGRPVPPSSQTSKPQPTVLPKPRGPVPLPKPKKL